jgi:hypothetical protein
MRIIYQFVNSRIFLLGVIAFLLGFFVPSITKNQSAIAGSIQACRELKFYYPTIKLLACESQIGRVK